MAPLRAASHLSAIALLSGIAFPVAAESKALTYTVNTGTTLSRVERPSTGADHKLFSTVRRGTTRSADRDWDGATFVNYGTSDFSGGNGTVTGFTVRTHPNGDQTFYLYQGKLKVVGDGDPPLTAGDGTVEVVGGTGKYEHAKGSGTWSSEKGQSTIKLNLQY